MGLPAGAISYQNTCSRMRATMPHGETLQVPLDRPAAKAPFRLVLPWDLAGDQPTAAAGLTNALTAGERHVTLRGVTGSGKTVTMAKVIDRKSVMEGKR